MSLDAAHGDASPLDLSGVPRGPMPRRVKPMLATAVAEPFDRAGWFFEIKWDGYRAIAEVDDAQVRLYSRQQIGFEDRYEPIVAALKKLGRPVVLDGEIVVLDAQGKSRFHLLQTYQQTGAGRLVYYVFDLLYLDGHDLRGLPLRRRKELLTRILTGLSPVLPSEHIEAHGVAFFQAVREQGLEGMVAKNGASSYREGVRGRNWLKVKTRQRQEAVIGGFTQGKGSRHELGAVVLGVYEGDRLVHIGQAGSGFTAATLQAVKSRLDGLVQKSCPFVPRPKLKDPVQWVRPELVCEVAFLEWTADGHIRQPIFQGLREDKPAASVRRELPQEVATVLTSPPATPRTAPWPRLSNLDKVFWPEAQIRKRDLIDYYRAIAPYLLPYLADRPLTLHRFPNGITGKSFFQKNAGPHTPAWIETEAIPSDASGRDIHYVLCQNEATLVYLANLGCIELHPWASRRNSLDRPDYLVLDLDPEDIPFEHVVRTARTVRQVLNQAGADGICKTSGQRGLHIFVPLGARYDYDLARQFAELLAHLVHAQLPETTSLSRSPAQRRGKIYLDYLQNRAGQTLAAAYSLRPQPRATVSTPLRWSEVRPGLDPAHFTLRTVPQRLLKVGDLWRPVLGPGIDLQQCIDQLARHSDARRTHHAHRHRQ